MTSRLISAVRSVALEMPDLAKAERFYTEVWHLQVCHRTDDAIHLRGCGEDPCLLTLHPGQAVPRIRHVTLRAASRAALDVIAQRVGEAGGTLIVPPQPAHDPAGGVRLLLSDPHGRLFEVVHGDATSVATPTADMPVRITHVVLNSHAVDETQRFMTEVFDFRLADRTAAIAFMNCNSDHHSIAIGVSDNDALNHIAFLMSDSDAVMRGGGRMKDAGFPPQWGPGRHGPGNNVFNYFIDPFGVVIEYTAEVEQIDDGYVARGPDDWRWPPGRVDQWGISPPPDPRLKEAQRRVRFVPLEELS